MLIDANRNGFFYVLDRTNGKLLAANPYVEGELGVGHRPEDRPPDRDRDHRQGARGRDRSRSGPRSSAARTGSRSPSIRRRGLLYANTLNFGGNYKAIPADYKAGEWYLGMDLTPRSGQRGTDGPRGYLKAIDPMTGKAKWEAAERSCRASRACCRPRAASSSRAS